MKTFMKLALEHNVYSKLTRSMASDIIYLYLNRHIENATLASLAVKMHAI